MRPKFTPEQQRQADEADRIMREQGFEAGMEAMRKIELTPEQRAMFNKYGDLIEEYGLMELPESQEYSSTERETKLPPST